MAWSCISGGSQTIHSMSRAALAASLDARRKLKEIAAKTLGAIVRPAKFDRPSGGFGKTHNLPAVIDPKDALAADVIVLHCGHECPADVNKMTKASVAALAGQGLVAVARDSFPRAGQTYSYVASFAEVEVDIETGMHRVVDFHAEADAGIVIHPRAFAGQLAGGSMLGIGHATMQKWFYDNQQGKPVSRRFYHTRPPTVLCFPEKFTWGAVGIPDPQTPVGTRGIGEPPTGAACAAVLCALTDALGDDKFLRAPVMADAILAAVQRGAWRRPGGFSANV